MYFLNKLITDIGKIRPTFFSLRWRGPKSMAKLDGGHGGIGPPGSGPGRARAPAGCHRSGSIPSDSLLQPS